jgi:hypothetical protein
MAVRKSAKSISLGVLHGVGFGLINTLHFSTGQEALRLSALDLSALAQVVQLAVPNPAILQLILQLSAFSMNYLRSRCDFSGKTARVFCSRSLSVDMCIFGCRSATGSSRLSL